MIKVFSAFNLVSLVYLYLVGKCFTILRYTNSHSISILTGLFEQRTRNRKLILMTWLLDLVVGESLTLRSALWPEINNLLDYDNHSICPGMPFQVRASSKR